MTGRVVLVSFALFACQPMVNGQGSQIVNHSHKQRKEADTSEQNARYKQEVELKGLEGVTWTGDIKEALQKARKSGRLVFCDSR